MDKHPEARTSGANMIDGAEFVRREPALAAVLADMALVAVRRQQQERTIAADQANEPAKKASADQDEGQ
jgi:hypothetical protein